MPYIFCISKRVCGLPIYGGTTPKQPPFTRQTLNDVSNKYEFVFFIILNSGKFSYKISRADFLLKIRGGLWTGSMWWSMDPGPCFLYVPQLSQTFGQ